MNVYVAPLVFAVFAGCSFPTADVAPEAHSGPLLVAHAPIPPVIDGVMSSDEWAGSLRISSAFTIEDGSAADGRYPLDLAVASDASNLYVAVSIASIGPNPFGGRGEDERGTFTSSHPDQIEIFLTSPEGGLSTPSDEISVATLRNQSWAMDDGFWDGKDWVLQPRSHSAKSQSDSGRLAATSNTTDSMAWEIRIPRSSPLAAWDGFQYGGNDSFRMLIKFIRQSPARDVSFSAGERPWPEPGLEHQDDYPGDGPTPLTEKDPSKWLLLKFAS